jgi:ATP-dependent protease ClpP protease subunit
MPSKLPRFRAAAGTRGDPGEWYRVGPVHNLAPAAADDDTGPAQGASSTTADVYLYDVIGGWFGLTADDFVRDVASLDVDQIVLHLNSPGGDALEGVTIANVLRAHRARVVVRVDGLAASAASVIAMAGDEVVMGIGSQMMVHDPWGVVIGNAAELEAFVRRLDKTGDSLASTLAAKAGGSTAEWRAVMRAETWYTAEEAVAAGLADRVATADETGTAEGQQITPGGLDDWSFSFWDSLSDADRFDLAAFTYSGRSQAPEPAMPGRTTPAATATGAPNQEDDMPFLDDVRTRLGVAANADEATTLAALDEALAEQTTDTALTSRLRADLADRDAIIQSLQADAALGRQAHDRQQRDDRVRAVDAAIADGRIAPARRDDWLARLEADPGDADTLAQLPKVLPVGNAVGHDHNDETPDGDLVDQLWGDESKGA